MSTAIYVRGYSENQQCLFSFGEGVEIEDMYQQICEVLDEEGFTVVNSFLVTSSEYLDVDLIEMLSSVQETVFDW
jgi:hypothetical protein|nr:MAG TPA: hypothetical protein [Caudoviricetes sp.]